MVTKMLTILASVKWACRQSHFIVLCAGSVAPSTFFYNERVIHCAAENPT